MRIVALEEHFSMREVREAELWLAPSPQDNSRAPLMSDCETGAGLDDLSAARIARMDAAGVDVAVLSLATPGVQNLDASDAVPLACSTNDRLADAVRRHPNRFEGFATLPTPDPEAAARELERAVTVLGFRGAMLHGRTRDRNLDHPDFLPILEAAAALRVPLYIHPQIPQPAVYEALYAGYGDELSLHFATGGLGWHVEAGIQALRLILAGTFDRLPGLQVILGHWGEVVLFYLERVNVLSKVARHLQRPVADYARSNLHVTPGGILSPRYLSWAIDIVGADRILFATDDPYVAFSNGGARRFLEQADLSLDDRTRIAHGNWDRLCAR
ncbi:amidohydrolase [Belnapia sp. T18]|uniref:Amidohydrolase n=1 Tax=Belnapia arida TaxID=2804533 RepID=A0ABS1U988_9PROT|nr:amidohydrolase family protein [Belnapia arida]MBL6081209.1 amidohydrolase [Belnapia arida]